VLAAHITLMPLRRRRRTVSLRLRVKPEHAGSLGIAIMCGVALEEGWSVGCVRLVRVVLRDRSVPPTKRGILVWGKAASTRLDNWRATAARPTCCRQDR